MEEHFSHARNSPTKIGTPNGLTLRSPNHIKKGKEKKNALLENQEDGF